MTQTEFRNVAIVAHVDHGKTTLVDAMLRQSGAFDAHAELVDRVMDSGDLEKEKGITILAKNTAIRRHGAGKDGRDLIINVIDTPGHADFGGEVERALSMVDGVVLLIDASEGPLPQTRFVLGKALAAKMPVIIVVNKTDRPDARIDEVVEEAHDLLLELASTIEDEEAAAAAENLLDLPVLYASGREGKASTTNPGNGNVPEAEDLQELFDVLYDVLPEPTAELDAPLQAHVTNLDSSSFLGRIGLVRVHAGSLKKGQQVAWIHYDSEGNQHTKTAKIAELLRTVGVTRVPTDEVIAGDIAAISGIEEIMIGDTLADIDNPVALPRITVDDPAISMTVGVNTSPLAGEVSGHKLTARQVKDRLDAELVGNVSIRVLPTDRPDQWEVRDRGELALAILVEQMRREGFELTVGKPRVVTRHVDGAVHEPMERATVDVPEEFLGAVTQIMAGRRGRMETMSNHGSGWVRMEFTVPARGMIGFRSQFLTQTRGTGVVSSIADGYAPWQGEIASRTTGSLVADRAGQVTAYALQRLEDRGTFFVEPGQEVYEGQVVGESPRADDMDVNVVRPKEMTNMRSSTAEVFETLQAPRRLTLEEAIEFASEDECVEVVPQAVRIRKVVLDASERYKTHARARRERKR